MQRTTAKISDDLDARLRHEAQRRGTTIAEITRAALEAHLGGAGARRNLNAAAAGRSGRSDISERGRGDHPRGVDAIALIELLPT